MRILVVFYLSYEGTDLVNNFQSDLACRHATWLSTVSSVPFYLFPYSLSVAPDI